MQFSGKITNSILSFLSRKGWGAEKLYELTDIPFEFLRDPSCWITAAEVELFLKSVDREMENPELLMDVGHMACDLRSWGVLDSVLRMMQKPQDIFSQPHRFISYFISPAPPIGNLQRTDESISFDLPISNQEYPLVTTYLTAALEGLPRYLGKELAQVRWRQTNIRIAWSERQTSLLADDEKEINPRPELLQTMAQNIELARQQIEEKDLRLEQLEGELEALRTKPKSQMGAPVELNVELLSAEQMASHLQLVKQSIIKLSDYLTRTQQALGFARSLYRKDPQLTEVLRRIDWENIRAQFPWVHMQALEALGAAMSELDGAQVKGSRGLKTQVEIKNVLEVVAEKFSQENRAGLEIKHLSFIEKPLEVEADKIQMALHQVVSAAARDINFRGEIQVTSRVNEDQVEIRVQPNRDVRGKKSKLMELPLLRSETQNSSSSLEGATEILAQMKGQINIEGELTSRAYVCRWPLH